MIHVVQVKERRTTVGGREASSRCHGVKLSRSRPIISGRRWAPPAGQKSTRHTAVLYNVLYAVALVSYYSTDILSAIATWVVVRSSAMRYAGSPEFQTERAPPSGSSGCPPTLPLSSIPPHPARTLSRAEGLEAWLLGGAAGVWLHHALWWSSPASWGPRGGWSLFFFREGGAERRRGVGSDRRHFFPSDVDVRRALFCPAFFSSSRNPPPVSTCTSEAFLLVHRGSVGFQIGYYNLISFWQRDQ